MCKTDSAGNFWNSAIKPVILNKEANDKYKNVFFDSYWFAEEIVKLHTLPSQSSGAGLTFFCSNFDRQNCYQFSNSRF